MHRCTPRCKLNMRPGVLRKPQTLHLECIWPWTRFFIVDIIKPPTLSDQIPPKLWMEGFCTLAVLHSTCRKSTIDWMQTPWEGSFWTASLENRRVAHHVYSDHSFHQRHAHDEKTKIMVRDGDESIRQCIACNNLSWMRAGHTCGTESGDDEDKAQVDWSWTQEWSYYDGETPCVFFSNAERW